MPVYHVGMLRLGNGSLSGRIIANNSNHQVLFKLKPDVTTEQVANWRKLVLDMKGQVPGMRALFWSC